MCNLQVLKRNLGFAFAMLSLLAVSCSSMAVAADDPPYKLAGGLAVYIGVVPAELVKGHPSQHAEKTMHGGAPKGAHQYHVGYQFHHRLGLQMGLARDGADLGLQPCVFWLEIHSGR
jgi:hypothetical protein